MRVIKIYRKMCMVLVLALMCTCLNCQVAKAEENTNQAQIGEGEFVPDPEMEKAIAEREREMELYFQSKNSNARSSTYNCLTNLLQCPQQTNSWCAYASMQSILNYEGISITQSQIVSEIPSVSGYSSYDFSGEGCPWLMVHGNDVSQFPAAVYLNSKLGLYEYMPYPYGAAGATTLEPVQIRARVVYSIDSGNAVLVNGTSEGGQTGYIEGYPTSTIGHWIVARGYSVSGDRILMVDPAYSSAVSWGSNITPYYALELDNLTGFAQSKGIMY